MTPEGASGAEPQGMFDYLRLWAQRTPDAPAYIFRDRTATYRELSAQVDEFAALLVGSGLRPGDRVAILCTPRPEFWISFLATVSIGGVWVGLNPKYQDREIEHVIRTSRPTLLFGMAECDGRGYAGTLGRLAQAHCPGPAIIFDDTHTPADRLRQRGVTAGAPQELARRRAEHDPARPGLIVFTSGSTGAPKGAVLSDRGMATSFRIEADHQFVDRPCTIANLPINHIAGVGDLCCTPLVCGGTIVFQEGFDPAGMLHAIAAHRVSVLMQVPAVLKLLTEHPLWDATDLSSLTWAFWGGGRLDQTTIAVLRAHGIRLGTTYGMTEITGSVTYTGPDADDTTVATTVGTPIPEVDLKLVAADGSPVAPGLSGEILVRHPGLLLEYFDDPDATRAAFDPEGFFRTGDIGRLTADGKLRLIGRRKEMFKSGGENVYPKEVELVLEEHPAVRAAAVVPVPDGTYGEVGVAFCETDRADADLAGQLHEWCRTRLANYKVPKRFLRVPSLPRLPVGKIDRQALSREAARDDAWAAQR